MEYFFISQDIVTKFITHFYIKRCKLAYQNQEKYIFILSYAIQNAPEKSSRTNFIPFTISIIQNSKKLFKCFVEVNKKWTL